MYQVIFFHYAHHALSILNHNGKHGCQSVTIFQLTKRAGVAFRFFPEHTLQIRILYTKSARKLAENCQNLGFR